MERLSRPGARILLRDVARQANVSGSTASRALADDPRISVATREIVKAAAADLHYVPNAAARSLRVRHTRTLGLLLPDVRDPVHGQIASAFEQEASLAGYCVIVVSGERDAGRERIGLRTFAEHGTDGVAVVSSLISPRELRERVDPSRLVHVWPDHRSMPRTGGVPEPGVVQTDDSSGVRAAVGHLIDGGSRRIAYAGDGSGRRTRSARRRRPRHFATEASGHRFGCSSPATARAAQTSSPRRWPRTRRTPWSATTTSSPSS